MPRFRLFILTFIVSLPPAFADDVVTLKNGDRISGKVAGMAGGKLVVDTPHSGPVKVDWTQVVSVKTDDKVKVRLRTGELLEGKLDAGQDGRLRIASEGAAAPVEVDPSHVTHFNEPPVRWHGALSISAKSTDGNTHTQSGIIAGEGSRKTESDLFLVKVLFRYGERSGEIQERNGYGLGKYQYTFVADLYGFASVEFLSDRFKDLSLGTVVAAGLGYDLLKESWIEFSAEAGIAFFDNNFRELQEDESHVGGRAAARARLALPFGFEAKNFFTWYPNFEDWGDWQIRNEATLGTALGGGWSALGGVVTEFDHEPADGLRQHDNTYFVGLGFVF